ncbi:hypothetical protein SDC9_93531 [bioreactor metagenome]|uniref:Uncharacterized protein n=1 Tax=bioreactor metagenome TaxID=1076179 RepID=A0A645AAW2_9ZZZZ
MRAQCQALAGALLVHRKNARRLARRADAAYGVVDGRAHLGVIGLPRMAHAGREIRRADEDAVHAVHRSDGLDLRQCFQRFHLHQQTQLLVGLMHVARVAAELRGPHRSAQPAHAMRRITHGTHGSACLLGILHKWDEQRLRADVQVALDQHMVVPRRAHDGMGAPRGLGSHRLQQRQHQGHVAWRVLGVEQDPVEA